jgi:hypothetical protein
MRSDLHVVNARWDFQAVGLSATPPQLSIDFFEPRGSAIREDFGIVVGIGNHALDPALLPKAHREPEPIGLHISRLHHLQHLLSVRLSVRFRALGLSTSCEKARAVCRRGEQRSGHSEAANIEGRNRDIAGCLNTDVC